MAQAFATRNSAHSSGTPVSTGFPHRLPVFDWS